MKEGQIRIPSGCAIAGIFNKTGKLMSGENIIKSIAVIHDRSNGLGGGFAAYGIYPEYKDYYAFHMFYDNYSAKKECEEFLERHFEIITLDGFRGGTGAAPTRIRDNVGIPIELALADVDKRLINLLTAWEHEIKEMMGGRGINSIETLKGNRLMLRGVGLNEKELAILGIKHGGE